MRNLFIAMGQDVAQADHAPLRNVRPLADGFAVHAIGRFPEVDEQLFHGQAKHPVVL